MRDKATDVEVTLSKILAQPRFAPSLTGALKCVNLVAMGLSFLQVKKKRL